MKKVLTVLAIMAIATGMVFAADAGFIAGREVSEIAEGADLKVTLQVDENMQNYFEIGFSGENVTTFEQEVTPLTKLTIATEKGNGEIGNAGNDAFVYWKAKGADITVSLAKSDNMTGDQGDETLHGLAFVVRDLQAGIGCKLQEQRQQVFRVDVDALEEVGRYGDGVYGQLFDGLALENAVGPADEQRVLFDPEFLEIEQPGAFAFGPDSDDERIDSTWIPECLQMGFGAGGDAFTHYPRPVCTSVYGDEFLKRKAGDGGFPDLVVHLLIK